jgi:multiple antibiotic resistance protein
MELQQILKSSVILFSIIDVVGTLPYILLVRKKEKDLYPGKAALVSAGLMFFFLFTGEWILHAFGITIHSFAIAGAAIIVASAIELVFGKSLFADDHSSGKYSSITPITFPMLIGAGTISTIVTLRSDYQLVNLAFAIAINVLIIYLAMFFSSHIEKKLSPLVFVLIRKFFGILVLAMGIQIFYTHVLHLFQ